MKFNASKAAHKLQRKKLSIAKRKANQKYKLDKINARASAKIGLQKELGKTARVAAVMDHTNINIGQDPNQDVKNKGIEYYNQMIGNATESGSSSSNSGNVGTTNTDNRGS